MLAGSTQVQLAFTAVLPVQLSIKEVNPLELFQNVGRVNFMERYGPTVAPCSNWCSPYACLVVPSASQRMRMSRRQWRNCR